MDRGRQVRVGGMISAGHAAGGAAGAVLGGALFDALGRYSELWIASLFISALAGVMILFLPDRPAEARNTEPAVA